MNLNEWSEKCHKASKDAGWWEDGDSEDGMIAKKLLLIHSEVSEATEGFRKGLFDDKLPHRTMLEAELVDVLVRCLDLCGHFSFDVDGCMTEKLAFNAVRSDHKPENRKSKGGKRF